VVACRSPLGHVESCDQRRATSDITQGG
jgi:hypothetical protein